MAKRTKMALGIPGPVVICFPTVRGSGIFGEQPSRRHWRNSPRQGQAFSDVLK
jgi:hypothetical protein